MSELNMKKHNWCHLEYEGHRIAAHFSAWSGKEIIYVDDHPVSETRNLLRFISKHPIELNKVPFTVELEVLNPFTAAVELRLKKGARTVAKKNQRILQKKTLVSIFGFFAAFAFVGFVAGIAFAKLVVG
jgi:hypothetical protein